MVLEFLFWTALAMVVWGVGGYAPFAALWHRVLPRTNTVTRLSDGELPEITVVIAAWNEAGMLAAKIENTRALAYPDHLKKVIFVTDGSDDGSPEWLAGCQGVSVLHEPERRGKAAAMNRAMRFVDSELVVFTDANAMLNNDALLRIADCFGDDAVGAVAGEKRVLALENGSISGTGEGLYWRYESLLKRVDSKLWSAAGAAGELFSVRTRLWEHLPEDTLLDDFVVSLRIAAKGYRIAYAPDAWAAEAPSANLAEEWKRKVRIAAGGLQAISRLTDVYSNRRLAFVFVSHRVLRWTLIPAVLPLIPIAAAWLALTSGATIYFALTVLIGLALLGAVIGGYRLSRERSGGILTPLFYFAFMNAAVWFGALRLLRGKQRVTWERAARHQVAHEIA